MSRTKSESHQKKKPTRQPKRKWVVVSGDVHLITDRPNDDVSIRIAGENGKEKKNDDENIITIISPDRGMNDRPERLFDDASSPSILSSLLLSDVQPVNNRFAKFKMQSSKSHHPY